MHDELNVQQYEEAIKDVINNDQLIDISRPEGDCIPDHIRKELALPAY